MELIITLILILSNWLIQELLIVLEVNLEQFLTEHVDKVILDSLKHRILHSKNAGMFIISH